MNISHKHKTIWWAPERCGTKATAYIFNHFDFDYQNVCDNNLRAKSEQYQSHDISVPSEQYSDYKVICSVRNPYDRMLGLFLNFVSVGKSTIYLKSDHESTKEQFSHFINQLFSTKEIKSKFGAKSKKDKPILTNYVRKYNINLSIPSYYIRMENIIEDIGKIDFINESSLWSSGYIENYLTNNQHINNHPVKFNNIYTLESAKKVYEYHKHLFLVLGYDPFSFTTKELSNEDKMKFLHGI